MNNSNLLQQISNSIMNASAVTSPALAYGAGLSVMSTLVGRRYCVPNIGLSPEMDDEPLVVSQSVIMVGVSGTGKGNTVGAAQTLLKAVDPNYPLYAGFSTREVLWRKGTTEQPLLIIENLQLPELKALWDKACKQPDGKEAVLLNLITEKVMPICRPFASKQAGSPQYALPSPLTIMAETDESALYQMQQPNTAFLNEFFNSFLLVSSDIERLKNFNGLWRELGSVPHTPANLIDELRAMYEVRHSSEQVLVQVEEEAQKLFRTILLEATLYDAAEMMRYQVLNTAALIAIGNSRGQPTITASDMTTAAMIGLAGCELARVSLADYKGLLPISGKLLELGGWGKN